MDAKYKKSLKIVTLLMSALIISTVSATIYYSLSVTTDATVTDSPTVELVAGADLSGATVTGLSATLAVDAYPGVDLTYEEALVVDNTGVGTPSVRLRHVSITNSSAEVDDFEYIKIVLLDDGGVQKGYLNYTVTGTTFISTESVTFQQMDASDNWVIRIETKAASAGVATTQVTVVIAVDVQV